MNTTSLYLYNKSSIDFTQKFNQLDFEGNKVKTE